MSETPPETPPDEPIGWLVLDPDGNVVHFGPQTVIEASADAGEETTDGSD
jgi:hypothetical protein